MVLILEGGRGIAELKSNFSNYVNVVLLWLRQEYFGLKYEYFFGFDH